MPQDLIDRCKSITGRTYADGYGFALGYLTNNPGPDELKAMRERAADIAASVIRAKSFVTHPLRYDATRFVAALAEQPLSGGWYWWLIEAAQLVLQDACMGNAKSSAVMRAWKHPGY